MTLGDKNRRYVSESLHEASLAVTDFSPGMTSPSISSFFVGQERQRVRELSEGANLRGINAGEDVLTIRESPGRRVQLSTAGRKQSPPS